MRKPCCGWPAISSWSRWSGTGRWRHGSWMTHSRLLARVIAGDIERRSPQELRQWDRFTDKVGLWALAVEVVSMVGRLIYLFGMGALPIWIGLLLWEG